MNTIKIISDDDVKSILDLENTILCVENAYRQKADKRATLLPLVSADLVEGKPDMDTNSCQVRNITNRVDKRNRICYKRK